jgi:gamma-glutamyltranspeptidase/glutathione hydrolase
VRELPVTIALCALSSAYPGPSAQDRPGPYVTRSEVLARNGMVATSQPLATQAGLAVLRAGGTAVDAAIAANAVLGVVEPTGCGIGGDLFALVWDAETRTLSGLNASGRAPRGLSLEKLRELAGDAIPPRGPLPITVPGCVDGWFELHARGGKLALSELLAPAIAYAREGFPVSELVARGWQDNARVLAGQPGFDEQFLPVPEKGTLVKRENLARTLEAIAKGGRDAFYRGALAEQIAAFVRAHGGFLAVEDLAAHRSEWVEPVSTRYRGFDVWELPPNGQGIAALQMLNLLEGFDLAAAGFGSATHLHLLTEAKKLAFEDRARFYADPEFVEVPVAWLVSKEYADERRKLIDPARAAQRVAPGERGEPRELSRDTVTLATADAAGNMVALIQSNYRGMGSGVSPAGLGFVLQDRGELFDLAPDRPNTYAPGKRPFHTIIPGFVTKDGEARLAFGVMGGDFQPQGHVQVLVNWLDFQMGLQAACDAPRFAHEGSTDPIGTPQADGGGAVCVETGFGPEVLDELKKRGHAFVERRGIYGGFQGIARDPATGVLTGASDPRKDGHAAGW